MMPSGRHKEYGQGEVEAEFVYNYIIKPAIDKVLGEHELVGLTNNSETSASPVEAVLREAPIAGEVAVEPGNFADRETDNLEPGAITANIIQKIHDYDFAIVDISGGNPNVFYELGVRHSLRKKTTIIMRQKTTPIPFDIGNYRVLDYSPFKFEDARGNLENILRRACSNKVQNDSLVVDVLGDYELIYKAKPSHDRMPWEFYFKTIGRISNILRTSHNEQTPTKKYSPDAVLGISNGGMIFADYLHRSNIYKPSECQFLSLWANRSKAGQYFSCKANDMLLKGIIEDAKKEADQVRLLLVDDNVSGGDTSQLAFNFIKDRHEGVDVRFLPLFFNRDDILPKISEYILWTHQAFRYTDEDILNLHHVPYRDFPYNKRVSGH